MSREAEKFQANVGYGWKSDSLKPRSDQTLLRL